MIIRRAKNGDLSGLNKLLQQVLMVHHNGRPDLFKPNVKKYTDEELVSIIEDDKKPIFVAVDEKDEVLPDDLFLSYSFAMVFCLKATS